MIRAIMILVITVGAALLGGSAYSQTPISTEKLTIRLGYQPLTPSWSATIITSAKLWKPYLPNVDIERFDTMSGMPLVNNMLAGRVDIAIFGDMPSIVLGSKSQLTETRLIAIIEADHGEEAVIYVKRGSPISSVKELNGKTVSVPFGGFTHRFAEVVEAAEGIKFNFVGQSPEVGLSNLQAGKVEAFIPWNPYGRLAAARGYGQALVDGTKYNFWSLRDMVASKDFIDKHPDVVVGWLRAELDAHKMMRERPDECAKMIFEDWKKFDVPLDVIRPDFSYKIFPDDIPPEWRKVLVDGSAFLAAHKFIEKEPDWSVFIDDSLLKRASTVPSQLK
jgi:NitT/TauT family transport system substrate-binding protein